MTTDPKTRIRVCDPAELIDTVPYLLGFHPDRSLALLGFSAGSDGSHRQIEVAVRVDLPDPGVTSDELAQLVEALQRSQVGLVIAMIYAPQAAGDGSAAQEWQWLTSVLTTALTAADMAMMDVLLVTADRWWSLLCDDPGCCPPTGRERAIGSSAAAAEAVLAGLVAARGRDEVESQLDGVGCGERAALEPYLAEAENRLTKAATTNGFSRLIRRDAEQVMRLARCGRADDLPGGSGQVAIRRLSNGQLARHAIALGELTVRDELWLAIDERALDPSPYLLQLIRRLPAPYDAAPLFLFGWQQWRAGNGTLAGMAAERALASDPAYSGAHLLLAAVRNGLNPGSTPTLRQARAG